MAAWLFGVREPAKETIIDIHRAWSFESMPYKLLLAGGLLYNFLTPVLSFNRIELMPCEQFNCPDNVSLMAKACLKYNDQISTSPCFSLEIRSEQMILPGL